MATTMTAQTRYETRALPPLGGAGGTTRWIVWDAHWRLIYRPHPGGHIFQTESRQDAETVAARLNREA